MFIDSKMNCSWNQSPSAISFNRFMSWTFVANSDNKASLFIVVVALVTN